MSGKNRPAFDVKELNQMQMYLGEEMIEDYREGYLSRRSMLKRLILICGGSAGAAALLTACGEAVTATPTTAPKPTAVPATAVPPTQVPATAAPAATAAAAAPTAAPKPSGPAVLSVAANDPAVSANDVKFQSDTEIAAYLARPSAAGTYPGVIVIHENRGLTDHIKDVTRRLAKAGFIALAPDLASREGGTAKVGNDRLPAFFSNAKPEDLVKDLNAAVDFLAKQSGVLADKYGVVGFCFGGAYAQRLAAANPKILAAVPYYGVTPAPADMMKQTNAAILAHYGGTDTRVNNTIPDLENTMKAANKTFEKKIWDGVGHAFNNDTGGNYNEAAAVGAWRDTLAWFTRYLR